MSNTLNKEITLADDPNIVPDALKKIINAHFDVLKENFAKHLPIDATADLIILKGHLLAEYYLNQLIAIYIPKGFQKIKNLKFYEKVTEVSRLNIFSENNIESVKRLNKLRNKLAHELEYTLTESDVDYIGFCFGKDYIKDKYEMRNLKDLLILYVYKTISNLVENISVEIAEHHAKSKHKK